jgi:glycine/D-amino acid oxidase-like deaminating enzyme
MGRVRVIVIGAGVNGLSVASALAKRDSADILVVDRATVACGMTVVAAGFSGHGFKISPAVGDLVADIVLEGESRDPVIRASDFRLERYSEGDLLKSRNPYAGASQMR